MRLILARGTSVLALAPRAAGVASPVASSPCGCDALFRMPPSGVASACTLRAAARAEGVTSEADRICPARGAGVLASSACAGPSDMRPVNEARGLGIDPATLGAADARGVAPVSDGRGLAMRAVAVGVLSEGELDATLATVAGRERPGVVATSEGTGGSGCGTGTPAAAASDSLRRAGPETGGRELVKVLLRRLRMGVFASLPGSSALPPGIEARVDVVERAGELSDATEEALPDRIMRASPSVTGLIATADVRGLARREAAAGVVSEARGVALAAGTGGAALLAAAVVGVRPTKRLGVLSARVETRVCCALRAASAAHFCTSRASRS